MLISSVCEFQSITNNTKCTIQFKNDTDLIEVKKLRDLYLQQFSSPIQPSNTKENEPINEEDTAEKDQSKQMGAKYTGSLIYTTSQGGNRLTGTFNVGV